MKDKIEYIGKTLLIDGKVLVIGDLHLGYEQAMRESGFFLPTDIFNQIKKDLKEIFGFIEARKSGKSKFLLEKIVLLGDLKHVFGKILRDEWREVEEILNLLKEKTKEIIIIKGNHDVISSFIVNRFERVEFVDNYLYGEDEKVAFLHGDRDFVEIYSKDIKYWIMGHAHPAINLQDKKGIKREKYKCFLEGKFKDKKIVVLPSFFSFNEGSDVLGDFDLGLAWNFDLNNFKVKIVQDENLEVLDFGLLKKLRD